MNKQQKIVDKAFANLRKRLLTHISNTNTSLLDKHAELSPMRQARIQAFLAALTAIESERVYLMIELG